ncbi:hypothetical protein AMK02_PC00151 (plasmid) [Rhizobium sp. N731]|nr:hypothetical protein AMK02_PC00151 [Rhizobium sp. N731]
MASLADVEPVLKAIDSFETPVLPSSTDYKRCYCQPGLTDSTNQDVSLLDDREVRRDPVYSWRGGR